MTSMDTPEHLASDSEVKSIMYRKIESEVVTRSAPTTPRLDRRPRVKSYLVGWAQVVEELSWKLKSVSFGFVVTNMYV